MPAAKSKKSTKSKDHNSSIRRVGVDLGGTKVYALVLDGNHKVLGSGRRPTQGNQGEAYGIENLAETIKQALDDAKVAISEIDSIGIGCPGIVDLEEGILKIAPNLGWTNIPIRKELKSRFACPVAVLNDVDAGTFGEYLMGAGKGSRSLLGVFPGTGLGAGFIYEGKILHGKRFSCMELSDLRVGGFPLTGGPGELTRIEDITSRLAITAAASVEAFRGKAPSLADLPLSQIKSKAISRSLELGEQAIIDIVDQSILYLGIGVSAAVSLLGPDAIVVGGGLAERLGDRYVKGLRRALERFTAPELLEGVNIYEASLGDDATAKGAAAYAAVEAS